MKTYIWILIAVGANLIGFTAGYQVSLSTGIEPGFFAAVETGSYGAPEGDSSADEGIDKAMQDYYKGLSEE